MGRAPFGTAEVCGSNSMRLRGKWEAKVLEKMDIVLCLQKVRKKSAWAVVAIL